MSLKTCISANIDLHLVDLDLSHVTFYYSFRIIMRLEKHDTFSHIAMILSSFPDNFKTDLLKYIDADQLPVFLGGTQTDPDGNPRCATKVML